MTFPTPNSDESVVNTENPFIGNFHKTLPHNAYGEVDPDARALPVPSFFLRLRYV